MANATQSTYRLELSVEQASDVAMALMAAAKQVAARPFAEYADTYDEMLDACDTYNTLTKKAKELFAFCSHAGCHNHRHPNGRRDA